MPEVVEITLTALFLNSQLAGKKITKINVLNGRYSRHPLPGLKSIKAALPLKVVKVDSKGKFMWFELKDDNNKTYYILNTFGLEGMWDFDDKKHNNVAFEISDGKTLYFNDSRNFGTLVATSQKKLLKNKLDKLGPDLLKEDFTDDEFHNRIKSYLFNSNMKLNKTRGDKKIIQILMDQTTPLGSGLGNYLAPEALYHAKISPHKTLYEIYKDKSLSDKLAEAIRFLTKVSFETAEIGYLGHLTDEMDNFVKELRKNKNKYHKNTNIGNHKFKFNVYRQKVDPHGNKIKAEKDLIKGRTTYWSPTIQH